MIRVKTICHIAENCLALIGLISICIGAYGVYRVMSMKNYSSQLILSKVFQKAGMERQWEAIESHLFKERFADHVFQGGMKTSHPRILYKDLEEVERIRERYKSDSTYRKKTDAYARGAVAWFCKRDVAKGDAAAKKLLNAGIQMPKSSADYGNAMALALQYDLLFDHPIWTSDKRDQVRQKFKQYIQGALKVLGEDSASLWHGRFELACSTWVVASVLDGHNNEDFELIEKAQAHFLDAVDAIRLTEGWPEGYNYWVNNRAYPFGLACLSHLNSVDAPALNRKIRTALETAGLWTIYGTRPDGRFVLFGDAGPRNDLKDETQRFIDLVTLGTRNLLFTYYSAYLDARHKGAGYYSAYRWGIPVFRGLPDLDYPKGLGYKDLSFLDGALPKSRIFGQGAFNQVFIRSDWGKEGTFISYRAGDTFTHHGHYQAGHFTFFKHVPLGLTSGTYGGYTSPHRLDYYIRTVASNSLLIQQPDEEIKPNAFFKKNVAGGGQKIIIPTGSAIPTVDHWKENRSYYNGGKILSFDNADPSYVYIDSDLTDAYAKDKAAKVRRRLCYINGDDLLIVHDVVTSVKKEYTKKWLFHTWSKPVTKTETVLMGEASNGILSSEDRNIQVEYQNGHVSLTVLLPEYPILHKIGGKDFRYYVETDGDDTELNGVNMVEGAKEKPWFDSGMWRIELTSKQASLTDEFFVLLATGKFKKTEQILTSSFIGLEIGDCCYLFVRERENGHSEYGINISPQKEYKIFGLPQRKKVAIKVGQQRIETRISKSGVLHLGAEMKLSGVASIEIDM